jgi:toxin ParE1/3/4
MRIRYTLRAGDDLRAILRYLDERSPQGAGNVKRAIRKAIQLIGKFPKGGRQGEHEPMRVLPTGRYPYVVYWTVENNEVWIVHIRHTARREWGAE